MPVRERPPLPPGPYLVVGLARSGQAAATLLAGRSEHVVAIDAKSPLGAGRLAGLGVEIHLNGDRDGGEEHVDGAGCVIKSPGVPREAAAIRRALTLGIPVIGELELGWRLLPNAFVAVTGTNGKTTVAELLGHIWRESDEDVAVAGNVGTPLASLSGELDGAATVICECSSFQLEDSAEFAPETAMLLNASPDHLDRHGSFDSYLAAKLRVFARQGEGDVALVDRSSEPVASVDIPGAATVVDVATENLPFEPSGDWLRGPHNLANARFAATAAIRSGLDPAAVESAIASFPGIAHRLERVAEIAGVTYVNDSKATNVAAAAAALRSFGGGVHVILGGSEKGETYEGLADPVTESCTAAYLIGPAADPIAAALAPTEVPLLHAGDLADAVGLAAAAANPGETVLLAPACASFDAFSDYEARGNAFRELVEGLAR